MRHYDPAIIAALKNSKNILVTTHVHPDGDAAGSTLGLAASLRKTGVQVDLAFATEIGERFLFLFENEKTLKPEEIKPGYNLVVILDIGSEDRTGFPDIIRSLNCPIINIDHHATNQGFADMDHVDIDASSTCQIVHQLLVEADLPVDATVAERLYLGLVSDSRHFQNSNVGPETFQTAAALMSTGFDASRIIRQLTQSRSELDLRVLGLGLTNMKLAAEGRLSYTTIRHAELSALGANHRHAWSAGLFGYLISLQSALVSISFVETDENRIFCEFRSKSGFDVSAIAVHFGGGGHRSASGCSQMIPMDEFISKVLEKTESEIQAYLDSKGEQ